MTQSLLHIDIAQGVAEMAGASVAVAVPVIIHSESGAIIWESGLVVPFQIEDWRDRCMNHHRTVRALMREVWPEVECYVDWWLEEPSEEHPEGIHA